MHLRYSDTTNKSLDSLAPGHSAHILEKVDVEGIVVIIQGIDASCQHSPSHLLACTEAQLLEMQTWKFWGEPDIFSCVT